MIKIIKPGILSEDVTKVHQGECPECHAILEYDRDNIFHFDSSPNEIFGGTAYEYVKCITPCCKGKIIHKRLK